MEDALKYISLITLCGAAISFLVGLVKWIDQRNLEQEQKNHVAFHRMICIASGVDETGRTIKMVQQVAAIYQLQTYKQYAFASIPVLKLMQFEFGDTSGQRGDHMETALASTIRVLERNH